VTDDDRLNTHRLKILVTPQLQTVAALFDSLTAKVN